MKINWQKNGLLNKPNPQFFNVEYSLQEAEQFLRELKE